MSHTIRSLIVATYAVALLAGCSGGSDDASDDRGGSSDITANPTAETDEASESGDATTPPASVDALPFNASGLLGGNASPTFPAGDAGEVTVVSNGPFAKDEDFGSAKLLVAFRNNTSAPISHVDLSGTARADGELVATGASQGTTPSQVGVGEVGLAFIYFESVGDVPDKGLDYDFAIETSPADTSSFNTAPFAVAEATNNGSAVIGTATNGTDATVSGPYSVAVYCFQGDQLADQIGSYADQGADIEPGGTVSFTVDLYGTKCETFAVGVSGYFV